MAVSGPAPDGLERAQPLQSPTRLLTHRLLVASAFVMQHTPASRHLPIAYFGASTGAAAAGAGGRTWRAYLSTQAADGQSAVNARDRIGRGPWQNFKGEVIAQNVDDLHSGNKLGIHQRKGKG